MRCSEGGKNPRLCSSLVLDSSSFEGCQSLEQVLLLSPVLHEGGVAEGWATLVHTTLPVGRVCEAAVKTMLLEQALLLSRGRGLSSIELW
jgi:hypothetical protein